MGHTGAYIIYSFFTGSSPPMLGIPLSAPGGDLSKWFIPTYVGHTTPWRSFCPARPVHPHLRGAYGHRCRDGAHAQRFIPTYVGHTAGRSDKCGGCTVHPHIRGAYHRARNGVAHVARFIPTYVGHTSWGWWPPCKFCGSSPHTWGIRFTAAKQPLTARFIPTYVGHTTLYIKA